ncbi:MAG: OBG GTPase family GTP-binding protein [Candidatus Hodarchaeota archaeon]
MQYNKATQGHFATLKARLAQLRSELVEKAALSKRKGSGFGVKKQGDATAILLGFPSVGKSTLLNAVTNKESKVAAYEFTTLEVIPGMIEYEGKFEGTRIQILDLPGIIKGGATGKGRGREILSTVRNADLIIILLDVTRPEHLEIIENELYAANIRLDQEPPNIRLKKRERGGILVTGFPSKTNLEEIANVLRTYRINNADVFLYEKGLTLDQIIDFVAGNRVYLPSLVVANKVDLVSSKELKELKRVLGKNFIPISAEKKVGLEEFKEAIIDRIGLIRVFLWTPGKKEPDMDEPLILKKGSTIDDVCIKIHKRFKEDFRYANIWGASAKFPGQKVGLNHKIEDSDIIRIILS